MIREMTALGSDGIDTRAGHNERSYPLPARKQTAGARAVLVSSLHHKREVGTVGVRAASTCYRYAVTTRRSAGVGVAAPPTAAARAAAAEKQRDQQSHTAQTDSAPGTARSTENQNCREGEEAKWESIET